MFLSLEPCHLKERRVHESLARDPSVAMVIAAVYFEWTVARAVMPLSNTPNATLHERMGRVYGLAACKELWKEEVMAFRAIPTLPEVVRDWGVDND
jgi:hypothetical protein